MTYMREFNASNKPQTCLWCGHKLRRYRYRNGAPKGEYIRGVWTVTTYNDPAREGMEWGDYGDNFFCGLSCGYSFARRAARSGYRFNPK